MIPCNQYATAAAFSAYPYIKVRTWAAFMLSAEPLLQMAMQHHEIIMSLAPHSRCDTVWRIRPQCHALLHGKHAYQELQRNGSFNPAHTHTTVWHAAPRASPGRSDCTRTDKPPVHCLPEEKKSLPARGPCNSNCPQVQHSTQQHQATMHEVNTSSALHAARMEL